MEERDQKTTANPAQQETMKAIVAYEYGPPEKVLEQGEVAKPLIDDDQVLVRVQAISVHPGDWHLIAGLPYVVRVMGFGVRRPKNNVPGSEIAGRVEAVGKNVTRFHPGDEVYGEVSKAYAQYVAAPEELLALKPANLTFDQAAAVPVSAFTALQGVRDKGEVKPGQKVLVIGASGGVGTYAVQIAKSYGAEVTGVCSTRNLEMVRSIGADHVIDYTKDDIHEGGQRYDVILDTAGSRSLSILRRALTHDGTLVIIGGEGGGNWFGAVGRTLKAVLLSPFVKQRLRAYVASPNKEDLETLTGLIESGEVTPVIDRTMEFAEIPEALSYLGEGHTQGKVVIHV